MALAVLTRPRIETARDIAHVFLADVGTRWEHTCGVARRAQALAVTVAAADRESLVAAAWLHDIGYSLHLTVTGFHPLDGAAFLERSGWPPRIAALVAHHSGARFLGHALGLQRELAAYPDEDSPLSDALAYADQTTGPRGEPLPIDRRIAGMLHRHGPDSVHAQVHAAREPHLLAAAARVRTRLAVTRSSRHATARAR